VGVGVGGEAGGYGRKMFAWVSRIRLDLVSDPGGVTSVCLRWSGRALRRFGFSVPGAGPGSDCSIRVSGSGQNGRRFCYGVVRSRAPVVCNSSYRCFFVFVSSSVVAAVEMSAGLVAYLAEQAVPLLEAAPVAAGRGRRKLDAVVPADQRSIVAFCSSLSWPFRPWFVFRLVI
jgi:hypothetical protein